MRNNYGWLRWIGKTLGLAMFTGGVVGEFMNLEYQTNRPTRQSWASALVATLGAILAVKA